MEASLGIAHLVVQVCVITSLIGVCHGQTVDVSVEGATGRIGNSATLECSYSIDAAGYALRNVRWLEGVDFASATDIVDFFGGVSDPTYFNDYDKQNVTATQTGSMSMLTIGVINFDPANAADSFISYWCEVVYKQSVDEPADRKQVKLNVYQNVAGEGGQQATDKNGKAIPTKWNVNANEDIDISLKVLDVFPETNFTWTLGQTPLAENTGPNCMKDTSSGLFNCTSEVTFRAEVTDHDQQLNCTVVYVPGQKEVELLITTLDVSDPCQNNPCQNDGTCTNWNGMPNCTCTDQFKGDNCTDEIVPTTPPEPTQPTGTDGKPITVPTTTPEPTQPTGTDGKPTEAPGGGLEDWEKALIAVGCVLAGLGLIGCGIYLCCTYNCCIWCGERCPWCREHCPCCRKPPKDREENIGMNNKGDSEEDHPTEKDQDHITKKDLT